MTNSGQIPDPDGDGQEHGGDVLAVRETVSVSERLKAVTCAWCGEQVVYAGVGRPPKYCRDSHRKRASELRTAQKRAGRPVDEGGQTREPVREVVERTETVTRTTVRRGPAELRLPEDIYEWQHALQHLQTEVQAGRFGGFLEVLVRDLEATAAMAREREEQFQRGVAAHDLAAVEALLGVPDEDDEGVGYAAGTAERPPGPPRPARPQGSKKKRRRKRR